MWLVSKVHAYCMRVLDKMIMPGANTHTSVAPWRCWWLQISARAHIPVKSSICIPAFSSGLAHRCGAVSAKTGEEKLPSVTIFILRPWWLTSRASTPMRCSSLGTVMLRYATRIFPRCYGNLDTWIFPTRLLRKGIYCSGLETQNKVEETAGERCRAWGKVKNTKLLKPKGIAKRLLKTEEPEPAWWQLERSPILRMSCWVHQGGLNISNTFLCLFWSSKSVQTNIINK